MSLDRPRTQCIPLFGGLTIFVSGATSSLMCGRGRARWCDIGITAAFLVPMFCSAGVAGDGPIRADNATAGQTEQMMSLVNAERTAQGLSAVSANEKLQRAAQWLAEDIATHHRLSHVDSQGHDLAIRVKRYGDHAPRLLAENIAEGQETPSAVVNAWLGSPPHRRNLLEPEAREAGVGHALDPDGQHYWVLDLGSRFTHR